MQDHHIVPREIFESYDQEIQNAMDAETISLPSDEREARSKKRGVYHCGSHDAYTRGVSALINKYRRAKTVEFFEHIADTIRAHIQEEMNDDANLATPISIDDIDVSSLTVDFSD